MVSFEQLVVGRLPSVHARVLQSRVVGYNAVFLATRREPQNAVRQAPPPADTNFKETLRHQREFLTTPKLQVHQQVPRRGIRHLFDANTSG
jgi:hypothetical protein